MHASVMEITKDQSHVHVCLLNSSISMNKSNRGDSQWLHSVEKAPTYLECYIIVDREWTGLEFGRSQRTVENREKMKKTGCEIICGAPNDPRG